MFAMIVTDLIYKLKLRRKPILILLSVLLPLVILWIFKIPVLKAVGGYLRDPDTPSGRYDVAFVLSGNAYDRSTEAARLYKSGLFTKIVCTGSGIPKVLRATDCAATEAELSAYILRKNGIPDSVITILNDGTSTREEGLIIKEYAERQNLSKLLIISSINHTRRIRKTLNNVLPDRLEFTIAGADDTSYDEVYWWTSEEGLIAVNNEYIKLIYYIITY